MLIVWQTWTLVSAWLALKHQGLYTDLILKSKASLGALGSWNVRSLRNDERVWLRFNLKNGSIGAAVFAKLIVMGKGSDTCKNINCQKFVHWSPFLTSLYLRQKLTFCARTLTGWFPDFFYLLYAFQIIYFRYWSWYFAWNVDIALDLIIFPTRRKRVSIVSLSSSMYIWLNTSHASIQWTCGYYEMIIFNIV